MNFEQSSVYIRTCVVRYTVDIC